MLPTRRGSNPQPPDHQSDANPTEPPRAAGTIIRETTVGFFSRETSPLTPNADSNITTIQTERKQKTKWADVEEDNHHNASNRTNKNRKQSG